MRGARKKLYKFGYAGLDPYMMMRGIFLMLEIMDAKSITTMEMIRENLKIVRASWAAEDYMMEKTV